MKAREISPFGLRMEPSLKERLVRMAEEQERSLNWLICKILKDAVQEYERVKRA